MPCFFREHRDGRGVSLIYTDGYGPWRLVFGPIADAAAAELARQACNKLERVLRRHWDLARPRPRALPRGRRRVNGSEV